MFVDVYVVVVDLCLGLLDRRFGDSWLDLSLDLRLGLGLGLGLDLRLGLDLGRCCFLFRVVRIFRHGTYSTFDIL